MEVDPNEAEAVQIKTLFEIDLEVMVKDFTSQKSGTSKATYQICCNSCDEFIKLTWSSIETYIQKELIVNEDGRYEWSTEEMSHEDLHKFVSFHDKISKRTYEVLQVTNKLLHSWKLKKGLVCFVHVYGNILKKKQHYEIAYKQAIQPDDTDRAGAVSNSEVFKCIDELKSLHPDLVGNEASWLRWANWIKKQQGHERESLMREDPPAVKPNLLQLFSTVESTSARVDELRRNVAIGKRVNDGILSALPHIESEVDGLIETFSSGLRRAERVKGLLESLRGQLVSNDNLMDGFDEALGPVEDEFSQNELLDMANIDDIDHQQQDDLQ